MPEATVVSSWGNIAGGPHTVLPVRSRSEAFPDITPAASALPFGNGRSYGDSCLNTGGVLLQTRSLDRFIHFDRESGVLACEAGILLADILRLAVPAGWFLPVVPGTQYVTVGGAIANDVHGKNHHCAGTFGGHLRRLELLRSDGTRFWCSPTEQPDWFCATVGGLGLTGLIVAAELQLRPVAGPWMEVETIRYSSLEAFFHLSEASDRSHEYSVAWIDCLAGGKNTGRGLLQRANHSKRPDMGPARRSRGLSIPIAPPVSLVNPVSLRLFNTLHYHRQRRTCVTATTHYQSFFFPLDGIGNWNRLYGPRGFYQYQCVIPAGAAHWATAELLAETRASGLGSFLAVLKRCGAAGSPGLLSFPHEGVTLALDFPNRGERVFRLFERLDSIVASAAGRLYPAKDARMPAALFRSGYPRWQEFASFIDPRCCSDFWRRVAMPT
jgi:FAD/FMN-containing dehydrogenase